MPRFGGKIYNICLFQPLSTQGRRDGGAPRAKSMQHYPGRQLNENDALEKKATLEGRLPSI